VGHTRSTQRHSPEDSILHRLYSSLSENKVTVGMFKKPELHCLFISDRCVKGV
jgi:hypothetical protein